MPPMLGRAAPQNVGKPPGPPEADQTLGVRIRGTLGDIDPLHKVPFERASSRVQKGPL